MTGTGVQMLRAGLLGVFFALMTVLPVQANDRVTEAEQLVSSLITELEANAADNTATEEQNKQFLNRLVDTYFDVDGLHGFQLADTGVSRQKMNVKIMPACSGPFC